MTGIFFLLFADSIRERKRFEIRTTAVLSGTSYEIIFLHVQWTQKLLMMRMCLSWFQCYSVYLPIIHGVYMCISASRFFSSLVSISRHQLKDVRTLRVHMYLFWINDDDSNSCITFHLRTANRLVTDSRCRGGIVNILGGSSRALFVQRKNPTALWRFRVRTSNSQSDHSWPP